MEEILKELNIETLPETKYEIREVNESGEKYLMLFIYEYLTPEIFNLNILIACSLTDLKQQAQSIYELVI